MILLQVSQWLLANSVCLYVCNDQHIMHKIMSKVNLLFTVFCNLTLIALRCQRQSNLLS